MLHEDFIMRMNIAFDAHDSCTCFVVAMYICVGKRLLAIKMQFCF